MTVSPFPWATRASRALRALTLLLMVLIAAAAIYALATGGVGAGSDGVVLRDDESRPANADVTVQCTTTASERHCARTERSNLVKAGAPTPGTRVVRSSITQPRTTGGVGEVALSLLALLLVLGILFHLERLLQALETASVFSGATVRRLQRTGLFVAALGFLPQIDIFALLRNAALSLATPLSVGPLPLAAGSAINIALILAGVFTVVIARVVRQANVLAEDLQGTV